MGKTALGQILPYLGPGFIITVGFVDPGNWATNIAGGSQFGYQLLWVITLSTLMLILLQNLSARLGIVTGRSMAANVRNLFPRWVSNLLGVTIILACAATGLAEYLGAALGLYLLFRIPLAIGAPLTLVLVVAAILGQRYKRLERMIIWFLAVIAGCYVVELVLVRPDWGRVLPSIVLPSVSSQSILVAMAILGAVVMPHNIYLHSNVIQSRDWEGPPEKKKKLLRLEFLDTASAMGLGWIVNSAMIVVAAAVFFRHGIQVTSIEQASATLRPLAGKGAQFLFGIALLFAGVGSSITSSMTEANVITGYLGKPEDPKAWAYRIGLVATSIPALILIAVGMNSYKVLILSQVALSVQLPFTVIPLLILVGSRKVMGEFASGWGEKVLGGIVAAIVLVMNGLLLVQILGGKF